MDINRSFTKYEKFGDTVFPVTYCENGLVLVDYPNYDPSIAEKITEEGKNNIEKLTEMLKKYKFSVVNSNGEKIIKDEEEKS